MKYFSLLCAFAAFTCNAAHIPPELLVCENWPVPAGYPTNLHVKRRAQHEAFLSHPYCGFLASQVLRLQEQHAPLLEINITRLALVQRIHTDANLARYIAPWYIKAILDSTARTSLYNDTLLYRPLRARAEEAGQLAEGQFPEVIAGLEVAWLANLNQARLWYGLNAEITATLSNKYTPANMLKVFLDQPFGATDAQCVQARAKLDSLTVG